MLKQTRKQKRCCVLAGHKNGAEYSFAELYENGSITERDLDKILKRHKAYFAQNHQWDHDVDAA